MIFKKLPVPPSVAAKAIPKGTARYDPITTTSAVPGVTFKYNNTVTNFLRWFSFNYGWDGYKFGLHFNDQYCEIYPEVQEAIRRLHDREPHVFDERQRRLLRASTLALHKEFLPKDQWHTWEKETWYLKPYLDEIEREKTERADLAGLKPASELRLGQHDFERF